MKIILLCLFIFVFTASQAQIDFDKKLKDLGIELNPPAKPVANYVNVVRSGNLLFLAGHGPARADKSYITGKVGKDLTLEQGYEAAKQTGINLLSTLKGEVGDLINASADHADLLITWYLPEVVRNEREHQLREAARKTMPAIYKLERLFLQYYHQDNLKYQSWL